MPDHELTRRELLAGAAAAAAATVARGTPAPPVRPVAVAKHSGLPAVKAAVERMLTGARPVDAAVAGVSLVEADPDEVSVGYGSIPNEEGVVQLDAAVMDGTLMRAGAVAALERIKHPSQVALAVMRHTTRILLVGDGALRFARAHGFAEENLLTERSRKIWLHWKSTMSERDDWRPDPGAPDDPDIRWFIEREGGSHFSRDGTMHVSACAADGSLGCCTSTSGLFFKIPGRVGDSPLIGSGLYCDGEVGSAGAVGHGESCIVTVGAHTVVEFMRQGRSPEQACLATLERVVRNTKEPYLKDARGRPRNNLVFFAVNRAGEVGSAAMWSGRNARYAVCRAGEEPRLVDCAYLFKREE